MKYILSFLFICVAVQCIQADEDRLKLLKKNEKDSINCKKYGRKSQRRKNEKIATINR